MAADTTHGDLRFQLFWTDNITPTPGSRSPDQLLTSACLTGGTISIDMQCPMVEEFQEQSYRTLDNIKTALDSGRSRDMLLPQPMAETLMRTLLSRMANCLQGLLSLTRRWYKRCGWGRGPNVGEDQGILSGNPIASSQPIGWLRCRRCQQKCQGSDLARLHLRIEHRGRWALLNLFSQKVRMPISSSISDMLTSRWSRFLTLAWTAY